MLAQEGLLEWKDAQQQVHGTTNPLDPAWSPGPDGGTHQVDRGDAGSTQTPLKPQIEIRRIDTDEDIGAQIEKIVSECPAQSDQFPQVTKYLGQPHHRQAFHREPGLTARRQHPRSGHADEARIRHQPRQFLDQRGPQDIARDLVGHDADPQHRSGTQRSRPRPRSATKSASGATSGTSATSSRSRSRAWSSLRSAM